MSAENFKIETNSCETVSNISSESHNSGEKVAQPEVCTPLSAGEETEFDVPLQREQTVVVIDDDDSQPVRTESPCAGDDDDDDVPTQPPVDKDDDIVYPPLPETPVSKPVESRVAPVIPPKKRRHVAFIGGDDSDFEDVPSHKDKAAQPVPPPVPPPPMESAGMELAQAPRAEARAATPVMQSSASAGAQDSIPEEAEVEFIREVPGTSRRKIVVLRTRPHCHIRLLEQKENSFTLALWKDE